MDYPCASKFRLCPLMQSPPVAAVKSQPYLPDAFPIDALPMFAYKPW